VIPIVDLRTKFGLPSVEPTERTSILVVDMRARGMLRMGIIVDAVSEVLNVRAEEIEPPPTLGDGPPVPFLSGIAKIKDRICLLLDIDQAVGGSEQYRLESVLN
jgi:purine-binding chemotaxis protein CheW